MLKYWSMLCNGDRIGDLNDKLIRPEVLVYLGCSRDLNKVNIVKKMPPYVMHMTPISNQKGN